MLSSGGSDWKTIHVKRINQETGETTGGAGGHLRAAGAWVGSDGWAVQGAPGASRSMPQPCMSQLLTWLCPALLHTDLDEKLDHVKFSVGSCIAQWGTVRHTGLWLLCMPHPPPRACQLAVGLYMHI